MPEVGEVYRRTGTDFMGGMDIKHGDIVIVQSVTGKEIHILAPRIGRVQVFSWQYWPLFHNKLFWEKVER